MIYSTDPFERLVFDNARVEQERRGALAAQIARVGVGKRVTTHEPGDEIVGRLVSTLRVARPERQIAEVDQSKELTSVDLKSTFLPAFVTGDVHVPKTTPKEVLALALNGRIAAVTRLYTVGTQPAYDMLAPESFFRQGFNHAEIFRVANPGPNPSLTLLGESPRSAPRVARGPRLEKDVLRLGKGLPSPSVPEPLTASSRAWTRTGASSRLEGGPRSRRVAGPPSGSWPSRADRWSPRGVPPSSAPTFDRDTALRQRREAATGWSRRRSGPGSSWSPVSSASSRSAATARPSSSVCPDRYFSETRPWFSRRASSRREAMPSLR